MIRLLLCTVALLTLAGPAFSADAVSSDPVTGVDPRETVNICDVYGRGFFYIPGGLTCLRIDGFVRFQTNVVGDQENSEGDDYTVATRVRASLDFDAREETEFGLLRGFMRIESTNLFGQNEDAEYTLRDAFIQYGNLTAGQLDSYWTAPTGRIRDGLGTVTDWAVGNFRVNQVNYSQAFGNFTAGVSLEDDGLGRAVPDVVGKIVYADTWGGAYLAGVYDDRHASFDPFAVDGSFAGLDELEFKDDSDDGALALKSGLTLANLLAPESLLKVEGHYAFDPTPYASNNLSETIGSLGVQNNSNDVPIEWAVGLGYSQAFGRFGAAASGQYGKTFDFSAAGVSVDGSEFFNAAVDVSYQITDNLSVLGEVTHREVDLPVSDISQTAGFVRLDRRF